MPLLPEGHPVAGETTPEPPCSSAPARKTKVTNSGAASDRNAYMVARRCEPTPNDKGAPLKINEVGQNTDNLEG